MDLTHFFLEADYANCLRVNNYIHGKTDSVIAVVKEIGLWPWRTTEMVDVVNWMRKYNEENPKDPINFIGVDMQYFVETIGKMDEILAENNLPTTDSNLYHQIKSVSFFTVNEEEDLDVYKRLAEDKNIDINLLNEQTKNDYKILYRHLNQALEEKYIDKKDWSFRDRKMAENIYFHLQSDTTIKGIFWAHNVHISNIAFIKKRKQRAFAGGYLKHKIGNKYFSIALDFDKGSFNAYYPDTNSTKTINGENYTLGPLSVPPAYFDSFVGKYRKLEMPVFIDCSTLPKKSIVRLTFISAVFYPEKYIEDQKSGYRYEPFLPSSFDAIILIDESTSTHLLD
jgi:erythromycin esterase